MGSCFPPAAKHWRRGQHWSNGRLSDSGPEDLGVATPGRALAETINPLVPRVQKVEIRNLTLNSPLGDSICKETSLYWWPQ